MNKKILIIYTSAGAGHLMAAKALEDALQQHYPQCDFLSIDALNYTNYFHKKLYADSYLSVVNYLPSFWGYLYNQFDKNQSTKLANNLLSFFDMVNAKKLFDLIREYKPDHVISTHFLPAELLNSKKDCSKIPNSVVITDYDAHNLWVYPCVRHYFVATTEVKHLLTHRGVKPDMISVTGIPVRGKFLEKMDRSALQKKWKLDAGRKTVLLMSGGFGVGSITQIVEMLLTLPNKFNLLVVAGKNAKLLKDLKKLKAPPNINFSPHGFTTEIHELMEVADLMITKSGGLTVTEALVKGVPMVITDPIPGQEERNADYLIEIGAGLKAHSLISLESKVSRLLEHPEMLDRMHHRALEAAKPGAAKDIVATALNIS